jgi:hypothetical protein
MGRWIVLLTGVMLAGCQSTNYPPGSDAEGSEIMREMAQNERAQMLAGSVYNTTPAVPLGPPCQINTSTMATYCPAW